MVPEGWTKQKLEDLALVERGKFSARPRNDSRFFGGDMPFVQTGDVTASGSYLYDFTQTLNDDGIRVSKVFPEGTILITIAANIGHTAITKFAVACPDSVVAIQPYSEKANVYWLKKLLETKREDLDSQATQNAQKNINLQVLKPLMICAPPLSEQKKIAQILFNWDQAITATERLLENSQQRKKGLMQQLLTGKKRLPGFGGEWTTRDLGSHGSTYPGLSGKTKEDFGTGEPFITYMGVFSDVEIRPDRFDYVRLGEGESQHRVQYGDILFTTSSETPEEVGMASVLLERLPYNLYLNSFCFGFRPHSFENLVPEYAGYLFRGEEMRRRISALAQGATRYNLSKKQLVKLDVLLPGSEEQKAISRVLATSDMELSAIRHSLDRLRAEKKALMQQLLTGKRRVKVNADAA